MPVGKGLPLQRDVGGSVLAQRARKAERSVRCRGNGCIKCLDISRNSPSFFGV